MIPKASPVQRTPLPVEGEAGDDAAAPPTVRRMSNSSARRQHTRGIVSQIVLALTVDNTFSRNETDLSRHATGRTLSFVFRMYPAYHRKSERVFFTRYNCRRSEPVFFSRPPQSILLDFLLPCRAENARGRHTDPAVARFIKYY